MRAQAGPALPIARHCRRMNISNHTDETLMSAVAEGDRAALAELVRRYQTDIYRFCLYYLKDVEEARELVQETFIRVYAARQRFDSSRKFRPWLLCIARNLCLNELKRKKPVAVEEIEDCAVQAMRHGAAPFPMISEGPDAQLIASERRNLVLEALRRLDADSRELLILRFFERLAARDIAEVTGSTEGAVRTRLHRVLKTLREEYGEAKGDF